VLEARERLGGRTWTSSFAGTEVEMGGAFVHWLQPHVWAELSRYGLQVVELPRAERAFLRRDDGLEELAPDAFLGLASAFGRFCPDPEAIDPQPMMLPDDEAAHRADRLSIAERLAETDLSDRERDLVDALCSGLSSTTNDRASYLSIVRTIALAGYDPMRVLDVNGRWAIRGGTTAIVDAIAGDLPEDIRLGTLVEGITRADRAVTIRTNGDEITASAAILTVPLNTLAEIRFDPPLSEMKQEAAKVGLTSKGIKVWAKVSGGFPSAFAAAPDRFPLSFVETHGSTPDGGTVVLGFGPSSATLPPSDHERVARAIEEMLPGATVEEVGGHDWVADPFARETWATYGPGSWLRWLPELARAEGPVVFAGSDLAVGGTAYIDGAIESGLRSAREIEAILQ